MRSNEIAKIAGVSVRTLRYYHQIGLLAEPSRQKNGYRIYDIAHLLRLLRIRQLTALGMCLSDLPAMLDGEAGVEMSMLAKLDSALAQQIKTLERQRQTIAALREERGPFDMPPELAAPLMSMEAGRADTATRAGRDQAVLMGHVFKDGERAEIACLYDRLAQSGLSNIASELGKQYDALGPESNEQQISTLAAAYVMHLGPWLKEFEKLVNGASCSDAGTVLWQHAVSVANRQQRSMMTQVSAMMRDKR